MSLLTFVCRGWLAAVVALVGLSPLFVHAACEFDAVTPGGVAKLTRDALAYSRLARLGGIAAPDLLAGIQPLTVTPTAVADAVATRPQFDVDCNGYFDQDDAAIIARWIAGFRGDALTAGLILTGRRNTAASVEQFLFAGCPVPAPMPAAVPPAAYSTVSCVVSGETKSNRWSDPVTWGGSVPGAGARVVIPAGRTIILDTQTAPLGSLKIEGALVADPNFDVAITSDHVLVTGAAALLRIGSPSQPYLRRATITLTGDAASNNSLVPGLGNKVLGVLGGTLQLHGRPASVNWTKLNGGDLQAGARRLLLADATGWQVGDEIVVATSTPNQNDYSTGIIESINGTSLTLTQPLQRAHFGAKRSFSGVSVDVRAEVGRLTQNIVVQGDTGSTASNVGGHSMFMADGATTVQIANVEFRRMGQLNRLGRYPVHFHLMANNCSSCYVRDSSVNGSIQRGFVVHGTENVDVSGNVSFNTPGHNFVLEDPAAKNNRVVRNLALVNRKPVPALTEPTLVTQNDVTPANFWMNGARNLISSNSAAGAFSSGFIYDHTSDGPSQFLDNTAHAAMNLGGDAFPVGSGLTIIMERTGMPQDQFARFTTYHNENGLWSEIEGVAGGAIGTQPDSAPLKNEDFVFYDNMIGVFGRSPKARTINERPIFIGGPIYTDSEAVRNQYGGSQIVLSPRLINFRGTFIGGHDTEPTVSRFSVTNVRAENSQVRKLPDDMSVSTFTDDTFLSRGTYYAPEFVAHTAPGCALIAINSPATNDSFPFYKCAAPSKTTELDLRALSAPTTPLHTTQRIERSDGIYIQSYGYQGAEFKWLGGQFGYTTVYGTTLTYDIETASASGYAMRLVATDGDNVNAEIVNETATVEIAVAVGAAPSAVTRSGTGNDPPTSATSAATLSAASTLAQFRANPLGSYWYDAVNRKVIVTASHRWVRIVP